MEHEITQKGPLLDAKGVLREAGFAKSLVLDYDRSAIRARLSRIKEWDYYCVLSGDTVLALTIDDNSYMGLLSASVLDLSAKGEVTESVMTAFPWGRTKLPPSSVAGVTEASYGGCSMRFEAKDGVRTIKASWPNFGAASKGKAERLFGKPAAALPGTKAGAVGLEVELTLTEKAPRESMVIATPFARAPRAFYYNQKINCQDAEGRARVGERELVFKPGASFGVLDWGRGVWTWSNTWIWGSSSGLAKVEGERAERSFGFNIGYGFGDTSASSENMVFLDGVAHKIGRLTVDLDDKDFYSPWHAKSEDGRFDLILTPLLDRAAATDALILASIQHQVFGTWSGTVILEDGKKIKVEELLGFCEKVKNRW
jgi:hypothetical protein